ncbi:zinc finger protein [Macleaya cordata]|uniref:RING-type E3 ubiquitin transferase n=1 Tax=Macleaya cordata TaxID=56857 RepID=A0A200R6N0_MACCD|nr:zinc finger protein [Macleaya cordata]
MEASLSVTTAAPPPPPVIEYPRSNISRLHYILIVLALTAILVVVYNVVFSICCPPQYPVGQIRRRNGILISGRGGGRNPNWHSIPGFTYRKEEADIQDPNCSVCLSNFMDGEDVRQLPICKHYFHSPCIDMWLYSHSNCPLCRAWAVEPRRHTPVSVTEPGDVRQDLPGTTNLV